MALPERDERLTFGGAEVRVKVAGETTGGAYSVIEEIDPLDSPLHVHEREDELFIVLEGKHVYTVGDQEVEAGPGDAVFAPRGVPHAQRRVVPRSGRELVVISPAGLESFFRGLARADAAGELGREAYARLSAEYRITWLD